MIFEESVMSYVRSIAQRITFEDGKPRLRLQNNWVLVKLTEDFVSNIRKTKSGILIDTSFNKDEHAIITGIVMATPQKLIYKNEPVESVEGGDSEAISKFDVDLEIMPGDKVYYHYLELKRIALKNGAMYYDDQNQVYTLVRYDKIYIAIRGETVIPINGQILIERIETKSSLFSNHIEIIQANITNVNVGRVRYVGSCVRRYFTFVSDEGEPYVDHGFVQPGDIAFFFNATNVNQSWIPGEDEAASLLKCNEKHIVAKVRGDQIFCNDHCIMVEPVETPVSRIIHNVTLDKVSGWLRANVVDAPERFAYLIGKEVQYQKTYSLTFDYERAKYHFVINAFESLEIKPGLFLITES